MICVLWLLKLDSALLTTVIAIVLVVVVLWRWAIRRSSLEVVLAAVVVVVILVGALFTTEPSSSVSWGKSTLAATASVDATRNCQILWGSGD